MTEALLEVDGVTKRFGGLSALNELSFEVREGEIVSVIGPNGAGKSTVFNVITGSVPARRRRRAAARPVDRGALAEPHHEGRHRAHVPERAPVPEHDGARERDGRPALPQQGGRVRLDPAHARGAARGSRDPQPAPRQSLDFFGSRLAGYRQDQPAFVLSYANRRRLEMARALATDPAMMLLDEPTAGMNPRETLELRDHIVRMRDELGLTVLVIEHDMRVVKGVSDRVVACDYGRKIAEGTYEEVANDEQVVEAYLGVRHEELG